MCTLINNNIEPTMSLLRDESFRHDVDQLSEDNTVVALTVLSQRAGTRDQTSQARQEGKGRKGPSQG
jgi:hypothetical protein